MFYKSWQSLVLHMQQAETCRAVKRTFSFFIWQYSELQRWMV